MRVYAKVRNQNGQEFYHSPNISHAVSGFRELGAEIINYQEVKDVYDIFTIEDIALDYIDQCNYLFGKFGIQPKLPNYPEVLTEFLGRKIWKDTINHINRTPEIWGIFVKPVKDKAFTGKIINNTHDLIGCGSCYEDYEVLCSDIVNIVSEYRAFIYHDSLIDIRPYNGDYHYLYNPDIVDLVINKFKEWKDRPVSCSIDFAVLKDRKTIFLELNDAYALGNYGLHHIKYAKLISARWSQLLNRKDDYYF